MKSPFQRRVAIASLLLVPLLGACGFNVQTDQVYQAAVGADNRDSTIDVLNAVVVTNGDGAGTFAGSLVNNTGTADTITDLTADDGVSVLVGGPVDIAPYGLVNMSRLLERSGNIPLVLQGEPVVAGSYLTLTFTFANADPVTIMAPIVDNTGEGQDYAEVPLLPASGADTEATDGDEGDHADTEH